MYIYLHLLSLDDRPATYCAHKFPLRMYIIVDFSLSRAAIVMLITSDFSITFCTLLPIIIWSDFYTSFIITWSNFCICTSFESASRYRRTLFVKSFDEALAKWFCEYQLLTVARYQNDETFCTPFLIISSEIEETQLRPYLSIFLYVPIVIYNLSLFDLS